MRARVSSSQQQRQSGQANRAIARILDLSSPGRKARSCKDLIRSTQGKPQGWPRWARRSSAGGIAGGFEGELELLEVLDDLELGSQRGWRHDVQRTTQDRTTHDTRHTTQQDMSSGSPIRPIGLHPCEECDKVARRE
ncbi:hypothetical protein J7T55_013379 [Diaporthe amygdali]|uniref:uncharacterized protein n=1 Tax=Phomopsis amygdali TaxID=1214568 RepID=UPI0022FEB582|nr:uncharacterized protein J7T55_013379 [Diaporthe amygdali]KAJ0119143.1 hypothetical protein J7T55_013379 [Diaporthe amygdali]